MAGIVRRLAKSRDLSVPDWGPYSKLYAGVSHLVRERRASVDFLLALKADGAEILTVEGMAQDGRLHPLQQAFWEEGAVQCGYCTPGMLLSAKALLDEVPEPGIEEVKKAISGNLCRCTGYTKIFRAVQSAADKLRKRQS